MTLKKNRPKTSMTFHLWRAFVMFAVIIMLVLWLFQVIFLRAFYETMKRNEIEKIGSEMVAMFRNDSDAFDSYLAGDSFKSGVFAHVLTADGTIIKSPQPMGEFQRGPEEPRRPEVFRRNTIADFNSETWNNFINRVSLSEDKTIAYVFGSDNKMRMVVYGAELGKINGETAYLYINSPLQPIDATKTVLQNQLIIVSVLSVFASLFLAYFMAKRFSVPIKRTSDSAKKLACGDYNVRFDSGNYREISELADVMNTTASELGKLDELRLDLMANVSHDLKTPLTIIKSYAEMIRDISGDNKQKRDEHTEVIIDETTRLTALVNDILSLSKLEAGIDERELKEFDISSAVKSVMEKFLIYTEKDGCSIDANIEDGICVRGDETELMQVIYNLIGNAINHSGGDKTITINLKTLGEKMRFEVHNSGDAIPAEELNHVWDRYYRSGKTHTRSIAGTGIGLSIVKHILEAHSSNFGVNSAPSEGVSFWFELETI